MWIALHYVQYTMYSIYTLKDHFRGKLRDVIACPSLGPTFSPYMQCSTVYFVQALVDETRSCMPPWLFFAKEICSALLHSST